MSERRGNGLLKARAKRAMDKLRSEHPGYDRPEDVEAALQDLFAYDLLLDPDNPASKKKEGRRGLRRTLKKGPARKTLRDSEGGGQL
jgi:hypothetical protein